MQPTVLIPVNRLDRAKGRLAALLEPEERAELVRRSLAAVLGAVEGAGMKAVVLTSDDELLILHADLPLVTAAALSDLVAQAPPAPSATLVRPGDGGTNAMLLRPPGGFPLAYGRGSGDLHEAGAREAGLAVRRADVPALALDLDTPADARALLSTAEGRASEAGRYLVGIGIEEREAFREG